MIQKKIFLIPLICFFLGCATNYPPEFLNTLSKHQQVLIVKTINPTKFYGELSAWENKGHWQKVYHFRVALGRSGIAAINTKKEGDGYTPSGIYPIGIAFGYANQIQTNLNYRQATDNDVWVDDINSLEYNQWVSKETKAKSFEEMKRKDHLYRLGAVIEYNMNPIIPGKGSAIFMHIWRTYYKPTSGCVGLSQRNMRKLLSWLDKNKKPVIVLVQD